MRARGSARLASVINDHISRRIARPPQEDLGRVTDELGIKLGGFPHPIPDGDYLVVEHCLPLIAGDTVLLLMMGDGPSATPIVIGRIPTEHQAGGPNA